MWQVDVCAMLPKLSLRFIPLHENALLLTSAKFKVSDYLQVRCSGAPEN
jgi:hypothetical protein